MLKINSTEIILYIFSFTDISDSFSVVGDHIDELVNKNSTKRRHICSARYVVSKCLRTVEWLF